MRRSTRLEHSSPAPSSPLPQVSDDDVVEVHQQGGLSDIGGAESTDDDADVLASRPTQRRRAAAKVQETYYGDRKLKQSTYDVNEDNWLADDDEVEYISSGDEQEHRQKSARARRRRRSRREQEELDADLEDLRTSDVEDSARIHRTRGGPVNTQRDEAREHFELLKRRRAGEKIPRVHQRSDDDHDDQQSDQGEDLSLIGRPADDVSDQGSVHSPVDTDVEEEAAPPVDDDNFVIDDDDEAEPETSRRPRPDIPLEFTQWMKAKPRELFPHIVEWLVKNKIAPAFPRDDDLFRLAFQRVNDQVSAQAGSRLISSAWNAEFKYTILARPQIAIGAMPGSDEDNIRCCDACNKTNRPARYDFVVTGEAYNKETLEPVEHDSEDEDRGNADVDEKGRIIASETKHFYLGSHCAANAQMGHKLTHWKFHLNETILEYLEEQGVLTDQQIVAREKKSKSSREKEAEAIVDSMEETGKVDELWADFQRDLKDAMLGMEDYTVKGGRSQGRVGVVRSKGSDGRIREWDGDKYRERMDYSDSDGM